MKSEHVHIVIMAGGQGARFWPLSRQKRPKQFLSISPSGRSLLQETARRVESLSEKGQVWVVTSSALEAGVREHLPEARVLCEPTPKNTAASIGFTAVHLLREDPDAVMLVLPADHAVKNESLLVAAFREAIAFAGREPKLVTVGIPPASAHTGYGYIHRGKNLAGKMFEVSRFFEKPNAERAKEYVAAGDYYWNSGMFVWKAQVILAAIKEYMPALYEGLAKIDEAIGTPQEAKVTEDVFASLESISIDFGVLEHAKNCCVLDAPEFGWSDVGSWDAWADHYPPDAQGNVASGEVLAVHSSDCIIHAPHRLIAVLGLQNVVVIDAGDAVLVCDKERVQEVREIVSQLKAQGKTNLI